MKIKQRCNEQELTELCRPKLKLFLSVDIVGSTSYKQRGSQTKSQDWLSFFVSFYSEFSTLLNTEVTRQADGKIPPLLVWKLLGDEVIFTVELSRCQHAADYLRAFSAALRAAPKGWELKPDRQDLALKGSAWLAGFPVGNSEVPLDSSQYSGVDGYDYIGPLIDTGFRLKEHSTYRKLIISADLAYLLVSTGASRLNFFFDGDQPLKGVLRGKPYPIIWIDTETAGHLADGSNEGRALLHRYKDDLLGRKKADLESLRHYLNAWFQEIRRAIPKPFIKDDPMDGLKPGEHYDTELEKTSESIRSIFMTGQAEVPGPQGGTTPPNEITEFLKSSPRAQEPISKGKKKPAKKASGNAKTKG